MLTFLRCALAYMEHTKFEDVSEIHIHEWKSVVQELIRESFKLNFILDYLQRLAHDMFSRKILLELKAVEARIAALRNALSVIALDPWHLASARRVSAESRAEFALFGLLV